MGEPARRDGRAVRHDVLDWIRRAMAAQARVSGRDPNPTLVGLENWVVATPKVGEINSVHPREAKLFSRNLC